MTKQLNIWKMNTQWGEVDIAEGEAKKTVWKQAMIICQDLEQLACRSRNTVQKCADNPKILSVTSPHIANTDNYVLANNAKMQIGSFSSPILLPIKVIYY